MVEVDSQQELISLPIETQNIIRMALSKIRDFDINTSDLDIFKREMKQLKSRLIFLMTRESSPERKKIIKGQLAEIESRTAEIIDRSGRRVPVEQVKNVDRVVIVGADRNPLELTDELKQALPENVRQTIIRLNAALVGLNRKINRTIQIQGEQVDSRAVATQFITKDIMPILDALQLYEAFLSEEHKRYIDQIDEYVTQECQRIIAQFQTSLVAAESMPPQLVKDKNPLQPSSNTTSVSVEKHQSPEFNEWNLFLKFVPQSRLQSADDNFWNSVVSQVTNFDARLAGQIDVYKLMKERREQRLQWLKDQINRIYSRLITSGSADQTITGIKDQINQLLTELIRPPAVETMSLEQIVGELVTLSIYKDQDRVQKLLNAFEQRLNDESEQVEPKRTQLLNLAAVFDAAINGTSQKKDFSANLNLVISPLAGRNATVASLALGYFTNGGQVEYGVDEVIKGEVPIDRRAIQMWEYIKKRIAHKEIYGGISRAVERDGGPGSWRDATGGFIPRFENESERQYQARLSKINELDNQFSYVTLNDQVVDAFENQIKLIFADIPSEKLSSLLLFYKTFGARSAGYMPWLMRGATRSHGFKPNETETEDESRYINPFALRMYQATRYDEFTFARFMTVFMLLDEQQFLQIVRENDDPSKVGGAKEFYEIMTWYNHSKWGRRDPLWLRESKSLFSGDDPQIDINGCIFPPLPEMYTSTLGAEIERDKLLAEKERGVLSDAEFASRAKKFVYKYRYQGYFPNYKKLKALLVPEETGRGSTNWVEVLKLFRGKMNFFASGEGASANIDFGQYKLAATAVQKMFDTLDTPMKMGMTAEEIITKITVEWNGQIIGKAKLIPGPHQQLFVPLTCQLISNLMYCYEHSADANEVDSLYAEIIERISRSPGLPKFYAPELIRSFEGRVDRAPQYMYSADHVTETAIYRAKLNQWRARHRKSNVDKIKRKLPILPGERISPYENDQVVSKETTSKK